MGNLLFWVYLTNSALLINHEIDSAYWREWKLFKLPFGITGFLILHFPLLFLLLLGLVLVFQQSRSGLVFSLAAGLIGLFAFSIHMYFIRKGREEFRSPISMIILILILVVSIAQIVITLLELTI